MKTVALLAIALAACAIDSVDDDGIDESFLAGGKADTGGISNADGDGVLRVANELSKSQLTAAGVSTRAARNIVAYRLGDDGVAGTADDEHFDTLAELDAVPYVGPSAFGKLLAYAKAHGYVGTADEFTLPSCTPMTFEDILARFEPGQTTWFPGTDFSSTSRTRDCNLYTGCSPWREQPVELVQMLNRNGSPGGSLHTASPSGTTSFELRATGSLFMWNTGPLDPSTGTRVTWRCTLHAGQSADDNANVPCFPEVVVEADPTNSIAEFYDTYNGTWTTGNTAMLMTKHTICKDGRFSIVTELAGEISPSIRLDGANNKNQIAVWGQL